MPERLQREIRDFIEKNIATVGDLELIFLLDSYEARVWDPESVSKEMRSNVALAAAQLADLHRREWVTRREDGSYLYTRDLKKRALIAKVRNFYSLKRITVIGIIYGRSLETMKGFADAFKIKKDE